MSKKPLPKEFYQSTLTEAPTFYQHGSSDSKFQVTEIGNPDGPWETPSIALGEPILKKILICSPIINVYGSDIHCGYPHSFLLPTMIFDQLQAANVQNIYLLDQKTAKPIAVPLKSKTVRNNYSLVIYFPLPKDWRYAVGTRENIKNLLLKAEENLNHWIVLDHHTLFRVFFPEKKFDELGLDHHELRTNFDPHGGGFGFSPETLTSADIANLQAHPLELYSSIKINQITDPAQQPLLTPVFARMHNLRRVEIFVSSKNILAILPPLIEELEIISCLDLDNLDILKNYPLLKKLAIRDAPVLKDLPNLTQSQLQEVCIKFTGITKKLRQLPLDCKQQITPYHDHQPIETETEDSTASHSGWFSWFTRNPKQESKPIASPTRRINTDTYTSPDYKYKATLQYFSIIDGTLAQADPKTLRLRETVENQMTVSTQGEISFSSGDTAEYLETLSNDSSISLCALLLEEDLRAMEKQEYFISQCPEPEKILPEGWVALSQKTAGDLPRKLAVAGASLLKIVRSEISYLYWLKLADIDPKTLTLQWIAAPNSRFAPKPPTAPNIPAHLTTKLSSWIKQEIKKIVPKQSNDPYSQILWTIHILLSAKSSDKDEKEKNALRSAFPHQLQIYLRDFGNKKTKLKAKDDYGKTLELLHLKLTACAGRTDIFYFLVSIILGQPVLRIGGTGHAWAEVWQEGKLISYDFRGHAVATIPSAQSVQVTRRQPVYSYHRLFSPYLILQAETLTDLIRQIVQQRKLFISVTSHAQAHGLYQAIFHYINGAQPVFYAQAYSHLKKGLTTACETDGALALKPGRFAEIMATGGILIIYWRQFNTLTPEGNHLLLSASLIDDHPRFHAVEFDDKTATRPLIVINLIAPNRLMDCPELTRRAPHLQWPAHISMPELPFPCQLKPDTELKTGPATGAVDLFHHHPTSLTRLLGNLTLTEKGVRFQPEPLTRAAEDKTTHLAITDPGKDNLDVEHLFVTTTVTGTVDSNGKSRSLAPGFTQSFHQPPPAKRPDNLQILDAKTTSLGDLEHTSKRRFFPLHPGTWSLLTRHLVIDSSSGQGRTIPGWLSQDFSGQQPVIIATEPLEGLEREFFHFIAQASSQSFEYLDLSDSPPPPKPELKEFQSLTAKTWSGAQIVETADPDFLVQHLKDKVDLVERIWLETTTPLFEQATTKSELESKTGSVQWSFLHQLQRITRLILDGKTVALNCSTLPPRYYALIQTLLVSPAYLWLFDREKPVDVTGRLLIITTPLPYPTPLAEHTGRSCTVPRTLLWEHYQAVLQEKTTYVERHFLAIQALADSIHKLPHGQVGTPVTPEFSFRQIEGMLALLQRTPDAENPIKSLLLHRYDKDCEMYAFINIACKLLFTRQTKSSVRWEKLKGYTPVTKNNFYRRLNACNGVVLRQWLKIDVDKQSPAEILAELGKTLSAPGPLASQLGALDEEKGPPAPTKTQTHRDKVRGRVTQDLKEFGYALLIGPTGSGKSHAAEATAHDRGPDFIGVDSIPAWQDAKPSSGKKAVLVLHEANLFMQHALNQIEEYMDRGLDNREVLCTANPFSGPGRSDHCLWQHVPGHTLAQLTDDEILGDILKPLCEKILIQLETKAMGDLGNHCQPLLTVWRAAQKQLGIQRVTLRDLQQLTCRFEYYLKRFAEHGVTPAEALYTAVEAEFFPRLPVSEQKSFLNLCYGEKASTHQSGRLAALGWQTLCEHMPLLASSTFFLSSGRRDILYRFAQQLELIKLFPGNVKSAVFLEGPSGHGKSAIARHLLICLKRTPITIEELRKLPRDKATDLTGRFVEITLTPELILNPDWLFIAVNGGCDIIFNELNGQFRFPALNNILTGQLVRGKRPEYPGSCFFMSQNPITATGRFELSHDLVNRLHKIPVCKDTAAELSEMLTEVFPPDSAEVSRFTAGFFDTAKTAPWITSADFFKAIPALRNSAIALTDFQGIVKKYGSLAIKEKEEKHAPVRLALQAVLADLEVQKATTLTLEAVFTVLRKHKYSSAAFNFVSGPSLPESPSPTDHILHALGQEFRKLFIDHYESFSATL